MSANVTKAGEVVDVNVMPRNSRSRTSNNPHRDLIEAQLEQERRVQVAQKEQLQKVEAQKQADLDAENLRVDQLQRKVDAGGKLTPTQVRELKNSNSPEARALLAETGNLPLNGVGTALVKPTVIAVSAAALGPAIVPVAVGAKVLGKALEIPFGKIKP